MVVVIDSFAAQMLSNVNEYVSIAVRSRTLGELAKYILEFIGFIMIILIFTYGYFYSTSDQFIPLMTMLAAAFYRLLPSVNRIIAAFNSNEFITKEHLVMNSNAPGPMHNSSLAMSLMKNQIKIWEL